jgi:hypothetical protein
MAAPVVPNSWGELVPPRGFDAYYLRARHDIDNTKTGDGVGDRQLSQSRTVARCDWRMSPGFGGESVRQTT